MMVGLGVFEASFFFLLVIVSDLEAENRISDANTVKTVYSIAWIAFLLVVIAVIYQDRFNSVIRLNALQRIDATIIDDYGPIEFPALGVYKPKLIQYSSVIIEEIQKNEFFQSRFEPIYEKLKEFEITSKKKINSEVLTDNLVKFKILLDLSEVNWKKYPIEILQVLDIKNHQKKLMEDFKQKNENKKDQSKKDEGDVDDTKEKKLKRKDLKKMIKKKEFNQRNKELLALLDQDEKFDWLIINSDGEDIINFDAIDDYQLLFPDEIERLKGKNITTLEHLINSDIIQIENELNDDFTSSKFRFVEKLMKTFRNRFEFQKEISSVIMDILKHETETIIEFSSSDFARFIETEIVNLKSLYMHNLFYLVRFDQELYSRILEEEYMTITHDDHDYTINENDEIDSDDNESMEERVKRHSYTRALVITPTIWPKTFGKHSDQVFFNGYILKCSDVTKAEFLYTSKLTHDVGILYTNTCDFQREHVRDQFMKVDTDMIQEARELTLIEMLNEERSSRETDIKQIKTKTARISNLNYQIADMRDQIITDMDIKKQLNKWDFNPKRINGFHLFMYILFCLLGALVCWLIISNT